MAKPSTPPESNHGLVIGLLTSLGVLLLLLGVLGWQKIQGDDPKPVDPAWMRGPLPGYVKLETFTTNLPTDPAATDATSFQYIQMAVDLKADSVERAEQLKVFVPEIKSNVLKEVMARRGSELVTAEGKDNLAKSITTVANEIAGSRQDRKPFADAFFTTFLLQ